MRLSDRLTCSLALHRSKRHRVTLRWSIAGVLVCAVVVGMSLPAFAVIRAATAPRIVPHLQFRPVLAAIPPAPALFTATASSRLAVSSCDKQSVISLGQAVPTTMAVDANPKTCVVLPTNDGAGSRYLLGKSALDGTSVKNAKTTFSSGTGWVLMLTLTPAGSRAFDALAESQFHRQIAVVADGVVSAVPTILPSQQAFSSFNGSVQISVGDQQGAAHRIGTAALLSFGSRGVRARWVGDRLVMNSRRGPPREIADVPVSLGRNASNSVCDR